MKRRLTALLAVLTALALVPAPPARAYEAHVLTFADTLDINTLNSYIATSGNIVRLTELTGAFFTRLDAHGNPVPELVTVIPSQQNGGISKDGKTITWHLRHGVKWSDGQPFDSSDVTFTWRVMQNKDNDIATRDPWERLQSITAPDKYTVVFRLEGAVRDVRHRLLQHAECRRRVARAPDRARDELQPIPVQLAAGRHRTVSRHRVQPRERRRV